MASGVRQLRWGIVGCGLISSDMIKAIKLLPHNEHEIVAVAARALDRAQAFALEHGVDNAKAYGTYDELFADPNVEVVYIGLLNHQHKSAVLTALDCGKHVLCEKPLALNVKETREMVDKARSKKLFLMEGYWSRFFPVWKQVKSEVQQKTIGDVNIMQCDFGFMKHAENKMSLAMGGGNLMATGCYPIMFALSIFGVERPELIAAMGFHSSHTPDGESIKERLLCPDGGGGVLMAVGTYGVLLAVTLFQEAPVAVSATALYFQENAGNSDNEINKRLLNKEEGGGLAVDIGCYPTQLSLLVFGGERPEQISAVGWQRGNHGVDDTASVTLKFSGNRMAQLLYTGSSDTICQGQICGSKGRLHIPNFLWCPDTLIKYTSQPEPNSEKKHYPVPTQEGLKFHYSNSGGLSYEAAAVRDCIINGLTECPDMTLDETLIIAEILQEIRRQLGVKYPQDDE
uniref:Trans-1,2-dihydrobenzene-1,2-diol dehydrogenase n=1 Tax=Plectus sambesii TaxID=2011161 RepID=A0A914W6I3_9BILA